MPINKIVVPVAWRESRGRLAGAVDALVLVREAKPRMVGGRFPINQSPFPDGGPSATRRT